MFASCSRDSVFCWHIYKIMKNSQMLHVKVKSHVKIRRFRACHHSTLMLWQAALSSGLLDTFLRSVAVTISENKKWVSPVKVKKKELFLPPINSEVCNLQNNLTYLLVANKATVTFWMFPALRAGTCELQYRLKSNKAGGNVEDSAARLHRDGESSGGLFNSESMTRRADTPPLLQKEALLRL